MNYQKIYDDICKRGQERILPKEIYTEKHHIIPRCLGGNDETPNLTVLTAREHFLVHYILAEKLYPTHYGLYHALYIMCHLKGKSQSRHRPSSKTYANIRETAILRMKQYKKENPLSREQNPMYGKTHSPEAKNKICEARSKKIIHIFTGMMFDSILIASKYFNRSPTYINSRILTGEFITALSETTDTDFKILIEQYYANKLLREHASTQKRVEAAKTKSNYGQKHTEETKQKMSKIKKIAQLGENNTNAKRTIHVKSGMIFNSRQLAAEHFNLTRSEFEYSMKRGVFKDASNI